VHAEQALAYIARDAEVVGGRHCQRLHEPMQSQRSPGYRGAAELQAAAGNP
jgi:hypothetical protein